jgi:hypothetical protein
MSSKRIYIPDSAERLVVPVESEFIENLKSIFGVGLFSELKQRLIPLALDVLRISLLGHTHPFETLRGLSDHQWNDLLDNPYTPSLVTDMLDDLENHPKLLNLVQTLRAPEMMRRLQVEWLYELTVGRFESTVPYLYREDKLLDSWSEFCGTLRDVSLHPFEFCKESAQQALYLKGSGFSEPARRLFTLSYMAACRKLFVFLSGARETWVGSYTNEGFRLSGSAIDLISSRGQRTERLVLKFGLVDHVYYLKPSMEQLNRFKECVKQQDLVFEIQKKLCPFVSLAGTGLNFNLMAEVFYRVYQPQRIRELQLPVKPELDESFLSRCGLPKSLATQLGYLPLNPEVVEFFSSKIEKLPRLSPFLRNPRTERGLMRQRLYRVVLEQLLTAVTQESLLSLCRQWNPQIRTPEGSVMPMISYVEANVKLTKDSVAAGLGHTRRRAIMEDLLQMLLQNTQAWQKAMEHDSFVTDHARNYFMTILDKAIEEQGSEEIKQRRHRDAYRVVCVVVE